MSISKLLQFVKTDIWQIQPQDLTTSKRLVILPLRILLLTVRGFSQDRCQLRASALTYYSLLSIVPVVAMMFGIAKGFSFERNLENRLREQFAAKEEVITQVIEFSHALLENTKGGLMAGIGIVLLFWTIIKVLSNIEKSFNDIWGVKKSRSFGRKISDYLSLILICPLLIVTSSTLTVVIASQVTGIINDIGFLGPIGTLITSSTALLPYAVVWALFTFTYIFMPNTKVRLKSALIAGVLSGTLFQIFQMVYINFQIGVAKYNAIYGSFSALPLFLIWLQISWLILLFGAELSFAHQNVDTYEYEPNALKVSQSFKRLVSLRMVHMLIKNFSKSNPPLNEVQISHELEVPIRLVRSILFDLTNAGIISQIKMDDNRTSSYQPAIHPDVLTIQYVLNALDHHGRDNIPIAKSDALEQLSKTLKAFQQLTEDAPSNKLIKSI